VARRVCGDNPCPSNLRRIPRHPCSMSSFQVRPATFNDVQAIADIHAIASRAAYEDLVPEEAFQATPMEKRLAFWRDAIEYAEPQVHVAVDGAQVIGFVGFDRSRDPKSKSTVGEIWVISVDPGYWSQGVGVDLWDAAREGLLEEECTQVTVWVPMLNDRAVRFFELAGFKREMNTAKTSIIGGVKLEEVRLKRALN